MHFIKEEGVFRIPGRLEVCWNWWSLVAKLIYSGSDGDDKWPWMLHLHLLFLGLFIHLPIFFVPSSKREPYMREWQQWGFSHHHDAVHFHWNEHCKVWNLPWFNKVHQRHEVRRADGSWVPFVGSWEHDKEPDGREELVFPFTYTLKHGEVQQRTATVFVDRRAWRPRWFEWTSLLEKSRQSIDVVFSDEVGELTGSWKGGCVGCGYEMLPGESPEQTLRRMEVERTFS